MITASTTQTFTAAEIEFVHNWAVTKDAYKDKCGVANGNHQKATEKNNETSAMGLFGELAVCKLLGGTPDLDIYPGGGSQHDLNWLNLTWQIKTSVEPKLIFNNLNHFASYGAILVHLLTPKKDIFLDPIFEVWGGISKTRFVKRHYLDDFGYGCRVVCDYVDVTPLEDIERILTNEF